jgi:dTDP-4-dehydrorhamnose reductase
MGATLERDCPRWICVVKSVAIIGSNGQLGTDLVKTFSAAGWKVNQLTHAQIEVEKLDSVANVLKSNKSDWIINTAAFHKVDECEKNTEKAWQINALGPLNVAQIACEVGANAVFISSDYVFSGNLPAGNSYEVDHLVSPVNAYGYSKAAGEIATLASNVNNLVVRISSVFGSAGSSGKGGNFVETIINKAKNGETLNVVNDIHMSPTYTSDASRIILNAIELNCAGILHGSNTGSATWYEFAEEILKLTGLKTQLSESQTNWELTPKRPKNSSLSGEKSMDILGSRPSWQNGLGRYLKEMGHI